MMVGIPAIIYTIAGLMREAGGRALLVGGAVVDGLLGREPKDWDVEVYGLDFPVIEKVLTDAGLNPKAVGQAFGVLKVNGGHDVDVSVPRRENKVGVGHADFEVSLDPNMTPKEAARRRDLTINSLFYDLEEGKVIDPFGGVDDLRIGLIRATDEATFVEDPLRVLRIMQLLPRKGYLVWPRTEELCREMVARGDLDALTPERVLEEFKKLLLKADRPSIGLRFLQRVGALKLFPECEALVGCQQSAEHHPEGDAWEHTLAVVDNAAVVRDWIDSDWQLAFMLGALAHDFGKPETTDPEDDFSAKGHDKAGVPHAEAFVRRMSNDKKLIERVGLLTGLHMQPFYLTFGGAKVSAWRRLHNKCRLDMLGWISLCDKGAATPEVLGDPHDRALNSWRYFFEFGGTEKKIAPKLQGRDLISRGHKPGPEFGSFLAKAYEAQLEDDSLTVDELYAVAVS